MSVLEVRKQELSNQFNKDYKKALILRDFILENYQNYKTTKFTIPKSINTGNVLDLTLALLTETDIDLRCGADFAYDEYDQVYHFVAINILG